MIAFKLASGAFEMLRAKEKHLLVPSGSPQQAKISITLIALGVELGSQGAAFKIARFVAASFSRSPNDSAEFTVIKPGKFAWHASVQDDTARTVVGMGVHFFQVRFPAQPHLGPGTWAYYVRVLWPYHPLVWHYHLQV